MKLKGNPVSPGVAVGRLYLYRPVRVEVGESPCGPGGPEGELERLRAVLAEAGRELRELAAELEREDPEKANIFVAHQDILGDETLLEEAGAAIREHNWSGDWALKRTLDNYAAMLEQLPDPLIQERTADLRDVCARLLRIWHGVPAQSLSWLPGHVVVAAHDLLPSDTATLDRSKVLAILTEVGGATSHSAIIARSYGIPAVLGIPGLLEQAGRCERAAVDALSGEVLLDPDSEQAAAHERRRAEYIAKTGELAAYLRAEPKTADGVRVDVGLNIGSAADVELEAEAHTDFVGLFRTEFLYLGSHTLPREETQYRAYKQVLERFGDRPVALRTLDVGGDKIPDCLLLPGEVNPFLGNRGLRLCFSMPEIFRPQLRAALRASVHGNLWLMLPMVSGIEEIRRAKELIRSVAEELVAEGEPVAEDYKVGIMIETPAIASIADMAAYEVDFASIGTNDLCQYLMAADRLNPAVSAQYQPYHPAVLRVIGAVADAFERAGKPLSVCGEMAGEPLGAALLVGLGVRKLSMGPAAVAGIKRVLHGLSTGRAAQLARLAADLPTAEEVERFLRGEFGL